MKWLLELGTANLACAGLPCGWCDEPAAEAPADTETIAAAEPAPLAAEGEDAALH